MNPTNPTPDQQTEFDGVEYARQIAINCANSPNEPVKRVRDMSNRFEVRLHRDTSFLAFAWNGSLVTVFPRKSFWKVDPKKAFYSASIPPGRWCDRTAVTIAPFNLFAYTVTPYKPSKGE